jgi:glycine betaine/proline transport system substrate-binding protein
MLLWESAFRLPFGDWVETATEWIIANLKWLFDALRTMFKVMYDSLDMALQSPPFWIIILIVAIIAFFSKGWKLSLGSIIGLLFVLSVNQWENAMSTLALVIVATVIAVIISIPLGILAAKSEVASRIVRPILDFLQTMPAMVYLIPALLLFRVGVVPGIVATVLFSLAPGVRLTELGIRGVNEEVVEAGKAFGSSSGRILRQIQLPLAMPSIMAGVNQVIMLALSMVVIAGMVGAGGLGGDVMQALSRVDIGLGFESGAAVVVLAILLDRITGGFGSGKKKRRKPKPAVKAAQSSSEASASESESQEEQTPAEVTPSTA